MGNKVRYETWHHTAWITIDRPDVRNAIDHETALLLRDAVVRSEDDDDVWVSVVTGAGDDVFCAGADLKAMAASGPRPVVDPGGFAGITRLDRSKPLVAAVNGPALGGGFEIALACDLVVASERARFALLETRRGIIAAGGALVHLARQLPHAVAVELAVAGRSLSAREALAFGLVNRVVAHDEVDVAVREMVDAVTAGAPLAVRESLAVLRMARYSDLDASWSESDAAATRVRATEDAKEGPTAFVQRREPAWSAR